MPGNCGRGSCGRGKRAWSSRRVTAWWRWPPTGPLYALPSPWPVDKGGIMSSAHAAPSVYSSADHPDRVAVTGVLAGPAFRTEVTAQGAIAVRVSEAAVATAFDELTPAVLLAAGVRHIHVDGQVVLSPELAAPTLAFVRF